jgi:hypothetical protein
MILRTWGIDHGLKNNVVNQSAVFLNLLCEIYRVDPTVEFRDRIEKTTSWILGNQDEAGGFPQGDHDSRRFLVYNAKIAPGLLAAFELLEWEVIAEALHSLSRFLITNQILLDSGAGLFISHTDLKLLPNKAYLNIYRAIKLVPGGRRLLVEKRKTLSHREHLYPIWIARSSLILYSLWIVERRLARSATRRALATGLSALMSLQNPIGGFPNSIGFNPGRSTSWTDIASPIRWNAYCYLLLSELCAADYQIELPDPERRESMNIPFYTGSRRRIWHENSQRVEIRQDDGKLLAKIDKRSQLCT